MDCALVASALPYYLEHQHRGVMVPCPYVKRKTSGLVETGIIYFVGPDVASRDLYHEKDDTLHEQLGVGATAMIAHMAIAVVRASNERGLPMDYFLTREPRRRLAVGSIAMYFAIHGPHVVVIKSPINEIDRTWKHVVSAGFSRLPYAPMVPAAVPSAEDISDARTESDHSLRIAEVIARDWPPRRYSTPRVGRRTSRDKTIAVATLALTRPTEAPSAAAIGEGWRAVWDEFRNWIQRG
jgi:hypothetical protein